MKTIKSHLITNNFVGKIGNFLHKDDE